MADRRLTEDWSYSVERLYRWRVAGRYGRWPLDLYVYGPDHSPNGDLVETLIIPNASKRTATEVCLMLNRSLAHGGALYPVED